MKDGYSLLYQLGSLFLGKCVQSDYFNRTIFNLLDKALEMETSRGPTVALSFSSQLQIMQNMVLLVCIL